MKTENECPECNGEITETEKMIANAFIKTATDIINNTTPENKLHGHDILNGILRSFHYIALGMIENMSNDAREECSIWMAHSFAEILRIIAMEIARASCTPENVH
jgi:hypothetical protein